MPRPRMPWFKVHTSILNSSFNYEFTLEEQACFIKLLALVADMGGTGYIADGEGRSIPRDFIANRIHVPVEVLDSTIEKGERTNRLKENSTGLEIIKWKEYQSEYNRQKPSREKRRAEIEFEGKCQNCFSFINAELRRKKAKVLGGAEAAEVRSRISELVEEGRLESEIVKIIVAEISK